MADDLTSMGLPANFGANMAKRASSKPPLHTPTPTHQSSRTPQYRTHASDSSHANSWGQGRGGNLDGGRGGWGANRGFGGDYTGGSGQRGGRKFDGPIKTLLAPAGKDSGNRAFFKIPGHICNDVLLDSEYVTFEGAFNCISRSESSLDTPFQDWTATRSADPAPHAFRPSNASQNRARRSGPTPAGWAEMEDTDDFVVLEQEVQVAEPLVSYGEGAKSKRHSPPAAGVLRTNQSWKEQPPPAVAFGALSLPRPSPASRPSTPAARSRLSTVQDDSTGPASTSYRVQMPQNPPASSPFMFHPESGSFVVAGFEFLQNLHASDLWLTLFFAASAFGNGFLSFALFIIGLLAEKRTKTDLMAISSLAAQAFATASSVAVFGLKLTPTNFIGVALTLSGGVLYARSDAMDAMAIEKKALSAPEKEIPD
ncbi:hypothetical protein P7C70_g4874, partial [Phenoliferia sp. Uapishka_3]